MEDTFLQTLVKSKKPMYFVSPHFDDAVLSAGALMTYLSRHASLTVITLFTKGGEKPYSLSAKKYLQQCGYADAQDLYADREKEDKQVLQKVTKHIINLGIPDALWRKKSNTLFGKFIPEIDLIYPTYRFHVIKGKIASQDQPTVLAIKNKLSKLVTDKNPIVFCPVGIGSHIDHVITSKVCTELFKPIYWSDYPYNENSKKNMHDFQEFTYTDHVEEKKQLIRGYQTQYNAMFHEGLKLQPEKFYYKIYE